MSSRNFAHLAPFDPLFDRLGADAERLAHPHPGLAIVRCRQLAELFASATLMRFGVPLPERDRDGQWAGLNQWLAMLEARTDTAGLHRHLRRIQDDGNRFTHVRAGRPYTPNPDLALANLKRAHKAGVWFQTTFGDRDAPPPYQPPTPADPISTPVYVTPAQAERDLFTELDADLDALEHSLDVARHTGDKVDSLRLRLRQRIDAPRNRSRLEPWQPHYLELRLRSIELAQRCHRGDQPPTPTLPADLQHTIEDLLADPAQEGLAQVILFHNRWVVLQTNGYLFEDAHTRMERLVASRRQALEAEARQFGVQHLRDEQFGRLLGTFGQLTAMVAWLWEDPTFLGEAASLFVQASSHFTAPGDLARQDTYWGHTIVERVRLGQTQPIPTADARRWEGIKANHDVALDKVIAHPFDESNWHHAFGASLRLKAALVEGTGHRRLQAVAESLSNAVRPRLDDPTWWPANPYEQLVGTLGMHMGGRPPKILTTLMDRIAGVPSVSGFVASVYRAQWAHLRGDHRALDELAEAVAAGQPEWPVGFDARLTERLRASRSGSGPWEMLPFNFA